MDIDELILELARLREAEEEGKPITPSQELCDEINAFPMKVKTLWDMLGQPFCDAFEVFAQMMTMFYVRWQRVYLWHWLNIWMPNRWAAWVSDHWPERWLPALPVEGGWLEDSEE